MEDLNEAISAEKKEYTDLSNISFSDHGIGSSSLYAQFNYQNQMNTNDKDTSNQENIPPLVSVGLCSESSFIKKYYTNESEIGLLKSKRELESSNQDSSLIEVDFDSYDEYDSKSDDKKDAVFQNGNPNETNEYLVNGQSSGIFGNWVKIKQSAYNDDDNNNEVKDNEESVNLDAEVKTEKLVENLEEMITILVPQDMDVKNIKLEPEDSGYEQLSNIEDDEEVLEIEDSEDFYMILVQDSKDDNKALKCKKSIGSNKLKGLNNSQLSKCDLCEYQTYDKSNLRKHKLIHTDLKPYTCNMCSFACKLPKYLKQHMVTHMTVRLFPCTVCCHRCRNLTELNRHIKRHLRLNGKTSVEDLSEEERSYCVCRDGCKSDGGVKKIKREKREEAVDETNSN